MRRDSSIWLTGKEIMEKYQLSAKEIGKACHEKKLMAYCKDNDIPADFDFLYDDFIDAKIYGKENDLSEDEKEFEIGWCIDKLPDYGSEYNATIASLRFNPYKVEEYVSEKKTELQGSTSGKATFNIPPSLWAGKTAEAAIATLREEGFSDEVIAYVLVKKMGTAKLSAGRLLFPPKKMGDEKEDSSYTRNIEKALKDVTGRYDITFMG